MKKEVLQKATEIQREIEILKENVNDIESKEKLMCGPVRKVHISCYVDGKCPDASLFPNYLSVSVDSIITGYLRNVSKKIESLEKELARL